MTDNETAIVFVSCVLFAISFIWHFCSTMEAGDLRRFVCRVDSNQGELSSKLKAEKKELELRIAISLKNIQTALNIGRVRDDCDRLEQVNRELEAMHQKLCQDVLK